MAITNEFLDELEKFSLIVNKRVTSNYSGSRKAVAIGQGLVFEDHQPYAPGEDYRRIDWKVYARTDHLFIRRFEEERNLTVRILVDSSGSMNFRKKWDYASMLAVGFAYLSMIGNEKFQLATFDSDMSFMQARRGRGHLMNMIEELNSMKLSKEGALFENVKRLKKGITSRSLIVLISDFLYSPEEIENALSLLAKHELAVIQVLDERELDLDYKGQYKLKDPEKESIPKTFISPQLK